MQIHLLSCLAVLGTFYVLIKVLNHNFIAAFILPANSRDIVPLTPRVLLEVPSNNKRCKLT